MELTIPMPKPEDRQALNLYIPREWHEALRERAFKERRHISDLVREALAKTFGYTEPEQPEEGSKGGVRYPLGGMAASALADHQR